MVKGVFDGSTSPFHDTFCFLLTGESANAAQKILEIAVRNEHKPHPFSEENTSLTVRQVARLLHTAGYQREVWYEGENASPILFRNAVGSAEPGFERDEFLYYLLTPVDAEDPDDVHFNEPESGELLTPEQQDELIIKTFGAGGLRIEFGAGLRIISDNFSQKMHEFLQTGFHSGDDFEPRS